MPRSQDRPTPAKGKKRTKAEFEDFVAAALKVDPKGLSGKHRKDHDLDSDDNSGTN